MARKHQRREKALCAHHQRMKDREVGAVSMTRSGVRATAALTARQRGISARRITLCARRCWRARQRGCLKHILTSHRNGGANTSASAAAVQCGIRARAFRSNVGAAVNAWCRMLVTRCGRRIDRVRRAAAALCNTGARRRCGGGLQSLLAPFTERRAWL